MKQVLCIAAVAALAVPMTASAAGLVNGDFEASSSPTTTPPGWTNIGHTDGVIAYATFGTPAYNGSYYYDIGGFGSPLPAIGDGITQTVDTIAGAQYRLTFGYSGENTAGTVTVLNVMIGSLLQQYTITADGSGTFQMPFTTASLNYLATGTSTPISFTVASSTMLGFNDPLIDGVSFTQISAGVPEPAAWSLMIVGFGAVGGAMRRRTARVIAAA